MTMNDNDSEQEKDVTVWAKGLKAVGKYYFSGIVDNVNSLLELHRRDTLCTFGTRTSVQKPRVGSGGGDNGENNDPENNSKVHTNNLQIYLVCFTFLVCSPYIVSNEFY